MTVLAADDVSAGSLALLMVVVLLAATVLLIRSMRKRIERLPESFDQISRDQDEPGGSASGPIAGA